MRRDRDRYKLYYEGPKFDDSFQSVPLFIRYKLFKKNTFYSEIKVVIFISLFLYFYFTETAFIFPATLFFLHFLQVASKELVIKSKKYAYTSGIIIERMGNTVYLLTDDDEYNTKEIAIKIS